MDDKKCGDCIWFVTGPGSGDMGACFDSYAQRYDDYENFVDSYKAVYSTDVACNCFSPKEDER